MEEVDEKSKHKCKFCSKMFPCGRSLGGHMRSHLINISSTEKKLPPPPLNIIKSHSEEETALCTKKRSKRYMNLCPRLSSEQEEVALSLILLSMDSNNNKRSKSNQSDESEVNSMMMIPLIPASESDDNIKFRCMICNKAFPSYQALGGHRASHKKSKGCCAPPSPKPPQQCSKKAAKHHECPICFKIFPSGQALGGHKRSHLITAERSETRIPQVRDFLDLNLPAPLEEDCNDQLKPWWIAATHEPLRMLGRS